MTSKTIIYYHRSYRKISGSGWKFLLALVVVGIFLSVAIFFACPFLSKWMSLIAAAVLSPHYPSGTIQIIEKSFFWEKVFFLEIPGPLPSALTIYANTGISVALIALMMLVKRYKNIAVFIAFLSAAHLVASLFFMVFGGAFPYTGPEFSELCIKSQIGIWLFIPFVLAMAFLPLPASMPSRIAVIASTMLYSLVFGTLRYIVFLYVISKFSSLYMAILYFAFGPLIDFIYIVGIYSVYSNRLAKILKGNQSVWKWAY